MLPALASNFVTSVKNSLNDFLTNHLSKDKFATMYILTPTGDKIYIEKIEAVDDEFVNIVGRTIDGHSNGLIIHCTQC